MGRINLSNQLLGSANSETVEFNGGVITGFPASDVLARVPVAFTVQSLTAGVLSSVAQSYLANTSSIGQVAPVLGKLIQELIRKKVIDGTFVE